MHRIIAINPTVLGFVFCFLATIHASGQNQYHFHYNIKKSGPAIYYTNSDTVMNNGQIASVMIHQFFLGAKLSLTTDNSGEYPVTTDLEGSLVLCKHKLKAALNQIDNDSSGNVYIDFWGIIHEKGCLGNQYINSSRKRGTFFYQIVPPPTLHYSTRYISVSYATTEIGVATVPFRYRFGRQKDTVHVPNDASASISAGMYVGRKWGITHFYIDKSKTVNTLAVTVGGFFTPTVIPLSPSNTFSTTDASIMKQLANNPNELGISTGIAAMLSMRDLSVGFFSGLIYPYRDRRNYGITPKGRGLGLALGIRFQFWVKSKDSRPLESFWLLFC